MDGGGGEARVALVLLGGRRTRRTHRPSSITVIALRTGRAAAAPGRGAAARTAFCPCGTALSALVHRGTSRVEGRARQRTLAGPLATRPARRTTACDCRPRCLHAAQTRPRSSRRTAASQAACATAARRARRKGRGARWAAAARRCSAAGGLHPTLHLASTLSTIQPTLASRAPVQHPHHA